MGFPHPDYSAGASSQRGATGCCSCFALPIGSDGDTARDGCAVLSRFDSRRITDDRRGVFQPHVVRHRICDQILGAGPCALVCFGSSRNLMNISANAQSIGVQSLFERPVIARFHGIWSLAGFGGAALSSLMVSFAVSPAWTFFGCRIGPDRLLLVCLSGQSAPTARAARTPVLVCPAG